MIVVGCNNGNSILCLIFRCFRKTLVQPPLIVTMTLQVLHRAVSFTLHFKKCSQTGALLLNSWKVILKLFV